MADTLVVLDGASMVDLGSMHAMLRHIPDVKTPADGRGRAPDDTRGHGVGVPRLVGDGTIIARVTTVHCHSDASGIPILASLIRVWEVPHLPAFDGSGGGLSLIRADTPDASARPPSRSSSTRHPHRPDVKMVTPVAAGRRERRS